MAVKVGINGFGRIGRLVRVGCWMIRVIHAVLYVVSDIYTCMPNVHVRQATLATHPYARTSRNHPHARTSRSIGVQSTSGRCWNNDVGVEGTRSVCSVVGVWFRSRLQGVGVGVVLGFGAGFMESVLGWCWSRCWASEQASRSRCRSGVGSVLEWCWASEQASRSRYRCGVGSVLEWCSGAREQ